jgi:hypothetical protein
MKNSICRLNIKLNIPLLSNARILKNGCIGNKGNSNWEFMELGEYNETVHQLSIDFKKANDSVRREV